MTWVKFHGELRRGKHRGIPRALRFVFLELCHEARDGRGTIELPVGMSLMDGVCDLLGGDRREVQKALELYSRGPDAASPTLIVEGEEGSLRLRIPSWGDWNAVDSSADRMRKHRANKGIAGAGDDDVTRHSSVTAVTGSDEGDAPRSDQIRSEKRERGERGSEPLSPAPSMFELEPSEPEPVTRVWSGWMAGWRAIVGRGPVPALTSKRRDLIRRRLKEEHPVADLEAAALGIWARPWHVDQDRTSIELALRDAEHIEGFARAWSDLTAEHPSVSTAELLAGCRVLDKKRADGSESADSAEARELCRCLPRHPATLAIKKDGRPPTVRELAALRSASADDRARSDYAGPRGPVRAAIPAAPTDGGKSVLAQLESMSSREVVANA